MAENRGFSRNRGEIRRETDCLLERSGFEISVPRKIGSSFEPSVGLWPIGRRRDGIIQPVVGLGKGRELFPPLEGAAAQAQRRRPLCWRWRGVAELEIWNPSPLAKSRANSGYRDRNEASAGATARRREIRACCDSQQSSREGRNAVLKEKHCRCSDKIFMIRTQGLFIIGSLIRWCRRVKANKTRAIENVTVPASAYQRLIEGFSICGEICR